MSPFIPPVCWSNASVCLRTPFRDLGNNSKPVSPSVLTAAMAQLSLKVKGHLLNITATFFLSVKCHFHVFGGSVSPPERLPLLGWRVMIVPIKHCPSEESTQQHLLNSSDRKPTHTQTHAGIIHLYTPPSAAHLCFCLCKITVVQVSSQQSDADRQACKRTAKHLCLPQRSFLSYNWLSCSACGFGYKNPLFQQEPPSSPRGTQRTREGAFQDELQSGFLFQRAMDVHGSWIPVFAVR